MECFGTRNADCKVYLYYKLNAQVIHLRLWLVLPSPHPQGMRDNYEKNPITESPGK